MHWNGLSGACCLPSCTAPRGDLEHLLSGACPALAPTLAITLTNWDNLWKSRGGSQVNLCPRVVPRVINLPLGVD